MAQPKIRAVKQGAEIIALIRAPNEAQALRIWCARAGMVAPIATQDDIVNNRALDVIDGAPDPQPGLL